MSEALDKVRDLRELPLFPLPIVLFPGVPLPLHIFEPRYREMLSDIRDGGNLFGLSFFDASSAQTELPPAGHIGCVAEVTEAQALPDGRSNIMTLGVVRYRLEAYVERGDSYLLGRVSYFEDYEEDSDALLERSHVVAGMFMRIARAVRTINDERANLPDISDTEPQRLSFLVAAAMEMELETKLEMLELRSTSDRLERLREMLEQALPGYEERARTHSVAKGNGHTGRKVDFE